MTSAYSTGFHDITSGTSGSFSATTGYDLVTGVGALELEDRVAEGAQGEGRDGHVRRRPEVAGVENAAGLNQFTIVWLAA